MRRFPVALVVGLLIIIRELHANTFPFQGHSRYKRQLGESSSHQIDLNITVPYIFSARLYPYGPSRGDLLIHGESEPYQLANPFHFLGQVYNTIYIESNGAVSFSPLPLSPAPLPVAHPLIAVYWMKTRGAKVFYRETDDANIVNLAHNEVNIQYRYGSQFRVRSVVVITWEGGRSQETDSEGNIFQLALIIGDSMTFAHIVYSKLNSNENAVAGFSSFNTSYSLPDSATGDAILLNEKSDIGIPGEWLFRIDDQQVFLCGAGFKGLECIDSCAPSQWFNDCSKSCHCDGSDPCDQETGRCPNGRCSPGWTGEPSCDQDIDECSMDESVCPGEQPDCLNTPGAFLCLCFEYDDVRKRCKGSKSSVTSALIPVEVVPLKPSLVRISSTQKPSLVRTRQGSTKSFTSTRLIKITTKARLTTASTTPSSTTTLQEIIQNKTNEIELLAPICPICSAHASCQNGICVCNPGWKEFGSSCIDIDECADGAHCGDHAECVNRPGSYDCTCEHGYRFENGHCFDIDECRENEACGNGLTVECVNHPGSFDCVCRDGFEGEPSKGCRDINECMLPGQFCGPHANCINTVGGFECECLPGYERLAEGADCTDIDECAISTCHAAAICSNLVGSFSCRCIDGFVGDGLQCHETILYPIANDSIVVPRKADSLATINLPSTVVLFNKQYDTVYLSSNGVLSFDRPLPGIIERAESLREPVVFALHAQYDYAREGLVAYTYVNESDAAAYSLLTRSSIGIQNHFRLTSFHTRALHVFTFDRMRQAGSENLNSFQIILAQSDDATMLTLIYEKTETKGPMTGIATPSSFILFPNNMLSSHSNIGQPGKWMIRVDGPVVPCPAGMLNPPLCDSECRPGNWGFGCSLSCHCSGGISCDFSTGVCVNGCEPGWTGHSCDQDVDECALGVVHCSVNAECHNSLGSFECRCKKGFSGNGLNCSPVERCFSRFGRSCSSDARCEESIDGPICICNNGLRGDGFRCVIAPTIPLSVEDITNQLLAVDDNRKNSLAKDLEANDVGKYPFLMKDWNVEKTTSQTTTHRPTLYTAITSSENDIYAGSKASKREEKSDDIDGLTLLFLILPALLCGIWIILVIVVIAVCCRKKRQSGGDSNHPFDGMWKAPPRRAMAAISSSLAATSHYGPRIRPYEGY